MKRSLVACIATALIVSTGAVTANADAGTIGGGTSLSTTLTSPADNAAYVSGNPVPVAGTIDLGQGVAAKDTDLVFVLDTSGSSSTTTGLSCGTPTNTVLDCEKAASLNVVANSTGARSPIAKVGVVAFPSTQTVPLTPPSSFTDTLSAFTPGGGTQFDLGITRARDMLAAPSTASKDLMVLFTDGDGSYAPVTGISTMVIKAFTIAGAGCSGPLMQAVSSGAPGSSCSVVTALQDLPAIVNDTIDSSLDGIDITVNGVVAQHLAATANGQSTTPFSTTLTGLPVGNDLVICAVAHATDAGGSGAVSDCATGVDVLPSGTVIVDCSGTTVCSASATDPGKSSLAFSAPAEFNETVTIAPDSGAPGACGGSNCTTGYHLGFPTTAPGGPIASITVVTTQKISLVDRLKAAVYIDGTRIIAQCNNRVLIARVRDKLGIPEPLPCITITYQTDGRLQYFVKFAADPAIRFR